MVGYRSLTPFGLHVYFWAELNIPSKNWKQALMILFLAPNMQMSYFPIFY